MAAANKLISQFVDVNVTKAKFARQAEQLTSALERLRMEGIICLKVDFPIFEFAFFGKETIIQTPMVFETPDGQSQPVMIQNPMPLLLFAIRVDYSNYDILAPSLRFINPVTSNLLDKVNFAPMILPSQQNQETLIDQKFKKMSQSILLQNNTGQLFICLRGLREYHCHPQHDGDSWFIYRNEGKGDILNILDQLHLYSITNYNHLLDQQAQFPLSNG